MQRAAVMSCENTHKLLNIKFLIQHDKKIRSPEIKRTSIFNLELCAVTMVHHLRRFEIMTYINILLISDICSLSKEKKGRNEQLSFIMSKGLKTIIDCFQYLNYAYMDMI